MKIMAVRSSIRGWNDPHWSDTYHNTLEMEKNDITPSLRPESTELEKKDVTHVESTRMGIAALEDETLMSGETQERVGVPRFPATIGSPASLPCSLSSYLSLLQCLASVSVTILGLSRRLWYRLKTTLGTSFPTSRRSGSQVPPLSALSSGKFDYLLRNSTRADCIERYRRVPWQTRSVENGFWHMVIFGSLLVPSSSAPRSRWRK